MPLMKAYNMSISPIENKVNTMKAKDIIAVLEKRGMKEASADHPIYSAPPTIRFINRSGTTTPPKRKRSDSPQKT